MAQGNALPYQNENNSNDNDDNNNKWINNFFFIWILVNDV